MIKEIKKFEYSICICDWCGKEFKRNNFEAKRMKHQFCSIQCFWEWQCVERLGNNNPNWKGGMIKDSNGYILISKPEHPFADKNGHVLEHRLIMEKFLGRFLKSEEIVHHKNEIRDDNRIKNLKLFNGIGEHSKHHIRIKKEGKQLCL